jgi:tetratricopeptide (TPR) repeat protein
MNGLAMRVAAPCFVSIALLFASWGTPARATKPGDPEVKARVEQLYLEGVAMYRSDKYDWAIKKFEEAYKLFPDPKLLYNIGRCHEAKGNIEKAIEHYERCAQSPITKPEVRRKAEEKLASLERAQKTSREAVPLAQPGTGAPAAAVAPMGTAAGKGAAADSAAGGTSTMSWAKWATGGVGLGLLAGGITTVVLGVVDQNKVDSAMEDAGGGVADMTRAEALAIQDDANTKKIIGYALIGAGAAALAGSAVLFVLDHKASSERAARNMHYAVSPLPGGGALSLRGTF